MSDSYRWAVARVSVTNEVLYWGIWSNGDPGWVLRPEAAIRYVSMEVAQLAKKYVHDQFEYFTFVVGIGTDVEQPQPQWG